MHGGVSILRSFRFGAFRWRRAELFSQSAKDSAALPWKQRVPCALADVILFWSKTKPPTPLKKVQKHVSLQEMPGFEGDFFIRGFGFSLYSLPRLQ